MLLHTMVRFQTVCVSMLKNTYCAVFDLNCCLHLASQKLARHQPVYQFLAKELCQINRHKQINLSDGKRDVDKSGDRSQKKKRNKPKRKSNLFFCWRATVEWEVDPVAKDMRPQSPLQPASQLVTSSQLPSDVPISRMHSSHAYEVLERRMAVAPKGHCTKLIRDLTMSKETFQNYMEDRFPTIFGSSQKHFNLQPLLQLRSWSLNFAHHLLTYDYLHLRCKWRDSNATQALWR